MDFNHRMDASEASALEQTWRTGNNIQIDRINGIINQNYTN